MILLILKEENKQEKALQIIELLEENRIDEAVIAARKLSPYRLTGILGDFPLVKISDFLSLMDSSRAADVLNTFPENFAADIINILDSKTLLTIADEMASDDLVDFLQYLSEEKKQVLLDSFTREELKEVEELASFPEDTVGAHMEQDFLDINDDITVEECLKVVKESPPEIEHTDYLYITDKDNKLKGMITLKELMFADRKKNISQIMKTAVNTAKINDMAVETAHRLRTRMFKMMPVVDEENRLEGVITLETAANLLSQNIADDIVVFSGSLGEESFFTRPKESIKMRLPWMAGNIFLNLGAVTIISSFEETIASIAILAAFLPMITDMGGNVGIQALSVSIRSLALGEAQLIDVVRALRKELKIGIFNGIILGLVFAVLAFLMQRNLVLSLVAGTALGFNVLVAGAIGGTMPFIIKKIGKDPALMTGPVLTTITDMTGVAIYLGLSTLLLVYII